MPRMTAAEKFELALIPLTGVAIVLAGDWLPASIGIGSILLATSVLLLFQGLIRDLWLLSNSSRRLYSDARQEVLCMCVESTVGVTGVTAGLIILGSGIDLRLPMSAWIWAGLAVAVLTIGFLVKDLVFEGRPFRIRQDKNHVNIIFSWKR